MWLKWRRYFLALSLLGLIGAGYSGLSYLSAVAKSGAGFKAKTLCSALFISGRTPESVDQQEFNGLHPLLDYISVQIDRAGNQVQASLLGLGARKAVFRKGYGCTLTSPDKSLADLPALPSVVPAKDDPIAKGVQTAIPGIDYARLTTALDQAFAEPQPKDPKRTRAVLVVKDGQLIAERYAPGFGPEMALAGYSMTKTLNGLMLGHLIDQGRLDLKAPAPVPAWQQPGDPRAVITLEQLVWMSSGLGGDESASNPLSDLVKMIFASDDIILYSNDIPSSKPPGTKFRYSTITSNILSGIIRRTMGENATDYYALPTNLIFKPLGASSALIEPDAAGTFVGGSFAYASARDWARIGQLLAQNGVWNGQQIIPQGWMAFASQPGPQGQVRQYGGQIWLNRPMPDGQLRMPKVPEDLLLMTGQFGQIVAAMPGQNVVIVRLGETRNWDYTADTQDLIVPILEAFSARN